MRYKPSYNNDARILLTAGGTETLAVEKRTTTTNSTVQVQKTKLEVDGTAADGLGMYHSFYIENDAGEIEEVARIEVYATDVSNGTEDTAFKFYTKNSGTLANRLTIDTGGSLSGVGDMSFSADQDVNMVDNNADAWAIKDTTGNEFLVFDTTTGTLRIELNQSVKVANTMNILAATVGGSTLGSTSNEWGSIYLASGKGVYFGSAQECNFLEASGALQLNLKDNTSEAFSVQTESGASEYFIITTTDSSETVTLGCSTADEAAQDTTIQAGNDVVIKCGTTAADTVKLQAYDIDGAAYDDVITISSHATTPTLALAADGGISNTVGDNLASAFSVVEGANTIIKYVSTNSSESLTLGSVKDITVSAGTGGTIDINAVANVATAFQVETGTIEYLVLDTTTGSEVLTVGASTADQSTQNTTVQAGNDVTIQCGTTAADKVVLQAYDIDGAAYAPAVTVASHATDVTLTLAATGGIAVSDTITVANTKNIVAATVGGSTLGSTSAEWGHIYLASAKGIYFGSAQECNLLEASGALQMNLLDNTAEAFSIQTEAGASEYFIITTSDAAETITLGCTTADEVAQNTTIQAGNDVVIRCGTTAADTVKIQGYDIDGTAYADAITVASHATDITLALAASGGIAVNNTVTVANTMNIVAATSGGSTLGSTSGEWGMIYVGDSKGIQFGAGQNQTLLHDGTTGLDLTIADNDAGAFVIKENATAYVTVVTTNDAESVTFGKTAKVAVTTVDMGNAKHTLVLGTAGANQTKLVGNIVVCDPNGGAQDLVLPAEASCAGMVIFFTNSADAGETVTIKDDAEGYTVIAVDQNQNGVIWCNGTTWYGCVANET